MLGWFAKPIPATPPLVDYIVTVHVLLHEPLTGRDGMVAARYYRVLGLRAMPDASREMIEDCVTDGSIDWDETEVRVADILRAGRKITKALLKPVGAGAWYKSGRMLHSDSD